MNSNTSWSGVCDQSSWVSLGEGDEGGLRFSRGWNTGATGTASEYQVHAGENIADDPADVKSVVKFGWFFEINWKSGKTTRVFYDHGNANGELPQVIREKQPVAVAWDATGVWRYSDNPPMDWVYLI